MDELDHTIIAKWLENIALPHENEKIEKLSSNTLEQNKLLLKYAQLRMETFELIKKAIEADTTDCGQNLEEHDKEIEKLLKEINGEK